MGDSGNGSDVDDGATDGGNGYKHGEPSAFSLANLPVLAKHRLCNTFHLHCIGLQYVAISCICTVWVVIYNCGWEPQLCSNDPQSAPATQYSVISTNYSVLGNQYQVLS